MGKRGPLSEWGVLAKTDGTDAQNLANFGKNIQSCLFAAKSEEKKRLYSLLTRSRQLAEMLTAEKTAEGTFIQSC